MKFSQRIGKTPVIKEMQIDSMDKDLRNGLWNSFQLCILNNLNTQSDFSEFKTINIGLWHYFYKLPVDKIPSTTSTKIQFIRERFFKFHWYEVYDFLEFIIDTNAYIIKDNLKSFTGFINEVMEREFSGYRLIDKHISPITNELEVTEIEEAINQTEFTAFRGANIHLKSALEKLSDKISPDYRNSIKESISAIESIVKVISGNEKDSLGGALDKIKGQIKLHSALEKGFKQIYGYTSDSDGIRHALMEDHNCDFEDAKYMLVASSAFINYLIAKANKAGIKFS